MSINPKSELDGAGLPPPVFISLRALLEKLTKPHGLTVDRQNEPRPYVDRSKKIDHFVDGEHLGISGYPFAKIAQWGAGIPNQILLPPKPTLPERKIQSHKMWERYAKVKEQRSGKPATDITA